MRTRPFTWDDLIVMEVHSGIYTKYFAPKPGDVVVDAGAHIGAFTEIASRLVGPTGCVYAFEPHPDNFALLRENVADLSNVVAFNVALGEARGRTRMPYLEMNTGAVRSGEGPFEVQVVRLDDVVPSADFLKVDVEGDEVSLLRGARGILKHKPMIAMEVNEMAGARRIVERLGDLGYRARGEPYWLNWMVYASPNDCP